MQGVITRNCESCNGPLDATRTRRFCDACRMFRSVSSRQNLRARKLDVVGSFTPDEWMHLCNQFGNVCLYCGSSDNLTPDHVLPLADMARTAMGHWADVDKGADPQEAGPETLAAIAVASCQIALQLARIADSLEKK